MYSISLRLFLCSILFLGAGNLHAQVLKPIGTFGSALAEVSGMEAIGNEEFIVHNDGGNTQHLFVIKANGSILRRIYVDNFTNVDWEDITLDAEENIYIADLGNNGSARKDLKIGIIKAKDWKTNDTVSASLINIQYTHQKAFPPSKDRMIYECEGLVYYRDSLYFFSKNRTEPYDGFTHLYSIPATPGSYSVDAKDSFKMGEIGLISWVTSADIDENRKVLLLLSSSKYWEFEFDDYPRLNKKPEVLDIDHFSQKEAICVDSAGSVFISDENTGGFGQVYAVIFQTISGPNETFSTNKVILAERGEKYIISSKSTYNTIAEVDVHSLSGAKLCRIQNFDGRNEVELKKPQSNPGQLLFFTIKMSDQSVITMLKFVY